jgi:CRISPR/Cas system-associated exonuclease Cas4 (RecB family)
VEEEDKRSMGRHVIIATGGDLIADVAGECTCDGNDYSRNLVVFPGKRPAHFLRKRIADAKGCAFLPPVVLSMEELVDRVYEQKHPAAPRKLETVDAVAFLFGIHTSMKEPLGGKEFLNLETFLPLGLRIYRDIEELLIEQVNARRLREVESLAEDPLPPQANTGLQSLSFFFERFYPMIAAEGFSTRSERFRYVSSEIDPPSLPFEKILFAGFYALTESEKRLFVEILSWENSLFLFQEGPGLEEKLIRLGVGRTEQTGAPPAPDRSRIYFHKSPDSHGQVFDLARLLRDHLGESEKQGGVASGLPADGTQDFLTVGRAVVVLPTSETLFPLLYHALPVIPNDEYNVSLGYPLERTPTWGFLSCLARVVSSMDEDRLYIPDYLGLVLHPYAKNIYMEGNAEVTRIIFHAIEEALLEDRTKSFTCLEDIEERHDLFQIVADRARGSRAQSAEPLTPERIREHVRSIHDILIRRACAFTDIKGFAGTMIDILTFIYENSSARLHPYFHPFAESFIRELDLLRGSRIRDLAFAQRNSYFHFLRKYIAQCFTPFEGTPLKGAQVLGFLETRSLRFDRVYILDTNEDVIPDTKKEDTLLPFKVRQILGMSTYLDRDALAAYYFRTLVEGSREAHIFFVENGRKERSRFVEQLLWERQKTERAANGDAYVHSLGYHLSLETTPLRSVQKTPAIMEFLNSRAYDATSLDAYLHCPLRFYYRYVLNLSKREEAQAEVEGLDVGRVIHRILFTYFGRRMNRPMTPRDIDPAEMREIAESILGETYGRDPIGRVYLLKLQVLRQMEAFLESYQLPVVEKRTCTILHLEHRIGVTIPPFRYKGVLDRVEERDGVTHVIDYKTGGSADRLSTDFGRVDLACRKDWADKIGSLQLPLYLFLYGQASGKRTEEMEASFLLLGKVRLDESAELPLFDRTCIGEADVKEGLDRAREVIVALAHEIADPQIPFDPVFRSKDACKFCDFRVLCAIE